jgi:hypothetical protein
MRHPRATAPSWPEAKGFTHRPDIRSQSQPGSKKRLAIGRSPYKAYGPTVRRPPGLPLRQGAPGWRSCRNESVDFACLHRLGDTNLVARVSAQWIPGNGCNVRSPKAPALTCGESRATSLEFRRERSHDLISVVIYIFLMNFIGLASFIKKVSHDIKGNKAITIQLMMHS